MHPRFVKGRYDCTEKVFKKNLLNADVNLQDVTIVPGFYDKTLNDKLKKDIGLNKAAIIMIDCDIYASTKIALDFITDLIDNGTIIIFDDWYSFKADPNLGEQKACNEWVEKNKNINLIPYGKYGHNFQMSFIVNKK